MGVDATIALLYAQTGLGTQFAHNAAVHPQASAAVSRVLALETAKQEQKVIQKTSPTEQNGVSKDAHHKQEPHAFGSRRRQREKQLSPEQQELLDSLRSDPFTGTFLNLTV